MPIINQSSLEHLVTLRNDNSPGIIPLSINNCKAPDLFSSPTILLIHNKALHVSLSIRPRILLLALKPSVLEERIVRHIQCAPTVFALQVAKDVVIVLALYPIECADLAGAFDTTGRGLVDIDVGETCIIDVLLYVEGDSCEGDGFTGEPADALQGEDGVGVIGEGFVLAELAMVDKHQLIAYTMTKVPVRFFIVTSGGAAIL